MPDSFSQLYIHHISAVKYRNSLIKSSFEEELYKYISGIIENIGQKPVQINGMPDHIHIAARLKPTMSVSKFLQLIKTNSSKWINDNDFLEERFEWQRGGATFSVSRYNIDTVSKYILNQKIHHKNRSFREEYSTILKRHDIDPDSEHLPDFFE